ncbi:hypothetical protein Tco_0327132, partial [Tanacetum coccineum]
QDLIKVERTSDLVEYVYNKYGDVEVTDEMYVLKKYGKKWKVEDEITDVILDLQIKYGKFIFHSLKLLGVGRYSQHGFMQQQLKLIYNIDRDMQSNNQTTPNPYDQGFLTFPEAHDFLREID